MQFHIRKIPPQKIDSGFFSYENRHIGIIYTAFGWFLVALSSVFFFQTRATHALAATCFHHYLFASIFVGLWAFTKNKKTFYCKNPFLLILNSLLCAICYYMFWIIKVEPAFLENSFLLNSDSLILSLILTFFFKKRLPALAWLGMLLSFLGIMCFFNFHVNVSTLQAIYDALVCLCCALVLSTMILLSTYLIKNNPPVVIALSHTLVGLVISGILIFFSSWQSTNSFDLYCMIINGGMYGVSLYFFINALHFTETYIIMSLSYLLPVFLILNNVVLHRGGVDATIVLGIILTLFGVIIVPIPQYLKERKKFNEEVKKA